LNGRNHKLVLLLGKLWFSFSLSNLRKNHLSIVWTLRLALILVAEKEFNPVDLLPTVAFVILFADFFPAQTS